MADQVDVAYWKHDKHAAYHARQFREPYRSTVHTAEFMRSVLSRSDQTWSALDVCCGSGANTYYLARQFPTWRWTGVDIVDEVLERGRNIIRDLGEPQGGLSLVSGDALNLERQFIPRQFHVVTSFQTLLCMPEVKSAIDNLFAMCAPGGWIFVTSLFTDFHVDVSMSITEYFDGRFDKPVGPAIYNVYSIDKFKADCLSRGARQVVAVDFDIDVDLPMPPHKVMGTRTVKLSDGKRQQISGPVLMPWKIVGIEVG